jgi:hypothetical protein
LFCTRLALHFVLKIAIKKIDIFYIFISFLYYRKFEETIASEKENNKVMERQEEAKISLVLKIVIKTIDIFYNFISFLNYVQTPTERPRGPASCWPPHFQQESVGH